MNNDPTIPRVAVVDYGSGNIESVLRAFRRLKADTELATRPRDLASASHIVLPGVGFFDKAIARLEATGLADALRERAEAGAVPLLGICLGFQLLFQHSAEGDAAGLGILDGTCHRFDFSDEGTSRKIPHMGWNEVAAEPGVQLLADIEPGTCFYFAHSYYVNCVDATVARGTTSYGDTFTSIVERGNLFGTQFHPEKSHESGQILLRRFLAAGSTR